MIARTVAGQQLRQAQRGAAFRAANCSGAVVRGQRQQRFVAVAEEAVVQGGIDVGHGGARGWL